MNQREKFEAWAAEQWGDTASFEMKHGEYVHMGMRNHWDAWDAALAASGGNAAPPDACPVAITDSSAPNGIKWYVIPPDHLKNGMNLYFVPAKIVPASAPNAALVAALEQVMRPYGIYDVAVCNAGALQLDFIEVGNQVRAALSAAGQEVGK